MESVLSFYSTWDPGTERRSSSLHGISLVESVFSKLSLWTYPLFKDLL